MFSRIFNQLQDHQKEYFSIDRHKIQAVINYHNTLPDISKSTNSPLRNIEAYLANLNAEQTPNLIEMLALLAPTFNPHETIKIADFDWIRQDEGLLAWNLINAFTDRILVNRPKNGKFRGHRELKILLAPISLIINTLLSFLLIAMMLTIIFIPLAILLNKIIGPLDCQSPFDAHFSTYPESNFYHRIIDSIFTISHITKNSNKIITDSSADLMKGALQLELPIFFDSMHNPSPDFSTRSRWLQLLAALKNAGNSLDIPKFFKEFYESISEASKQKLEHLETQLKIFTDFCYGDVEVFASLLHAIAELPQKHEFMKFLADSKLTYTPTRFDILLQQYHISASTDASKHQDWMETHTKALQELSNIRHYLNDDDMSAAILSGNMDPVILSLQRTINPSISDNQLLGVFSHPPMPYVETILIFRQGNICATKKLMNLFINAIQNQLSPNSTLARCLNILERQNLLSTEIESFLYCKLDQGRPNTKRRKLIQTFMEACLFMHYRGNPLNTLITDEFLNRIRNLPNSTTDLLKSLETECYDAPEVTNLLKDCYYTLPNVRGYISYRQYHISYMENRKKNSAIPCFNLLHGKNLLENLRLVLRWPNKLNSLGEFSNICLLIDSGGLPLERYFSDLLKILEKYDSDPTATIDRLRKLQDALRIFLQPSNEEILSIDLEAADEEGFDPIKQLINNKNPLEIISLVCNILFLQGNETRYKAALNAIHIDKIQPRPRIPMLCVLAARVLTDPKLSGRIPYTPPIHQALEPATQDPQVSTATIQNTAGNQSSETATKKDHSIVFMTPDSFVASETTPLLG